MGSLLLPSPPPFVQVWIALHLDRNMARVESLPLRSAMPVPLPFLARVCQATLQGTFTVITPMKALRRVIQHPVAQASVFSGLARTDASDRRAVQKPLAFGPLTHEDRHRIALHPAVMAGLHPLGRV